MTTFFAWEDCTFWGWLQESLPISHAFLETHHSSHGKVGSRFPFESEWSCDSLVIISMQCEWGCVITEAALQRVMIQVSPLLTWSPELSSEQFTDPEAAMLWGSPKWSTQSGPHGGTLRDSQLAPSCSGSPSPLFQLRPLSATTQEAPEPEMPSLAAPKLSTHS